MILILFEYNRMDLSEMSLKISKMELSKYMFNIRYETTTSEQAVSVCACVCVFIYKWMRSMSANKPTH